MQIQVLLVYNFYACLLVNILSYKSITYNKCHIQKLLFLELHRIFLDISSHLLML